MQKAHLSVVSEAWSLLSDKAKRVAYNHKRNVQGFKQEAVSRTGGPSVPPSASTFQNSMNSVRKTVKTSQQEAAHCSGGPSTQPSAGTFQNVMNAKTQQPSATTFQNVTNVRTKQPSATTFQECYECKDPAWSHPDTFVCKSCYFLDCLQPLQNSLSVCQDVSSSSSCLP